MENEIDTHRFDNLAGHIFESKLSTESAVKSCGGDQWESGSTKGGQNEPASFLDADEGLKSLALKIDGITKQNWNGSVYTYNSKQYWRGPTSAKSLAAILRPAAIPGNCWILPLFAPIPAGVKKSVQFEIPASTYLTTETNPVFKGYLRTYQILVDELSNLKTITTVDFRETIISGTLKSPRSITLPNVPTNAAPSHILIAIDVKDGSNWVPAAEGADLGNFLLRAGSKTLFEGPWLALNRVSKYQNKIVGEIAPGLCIFKCPVGDFPEVKFIDGLSVTWNDYHDLSLTITKELIVAETRVTVYVVSHEQYEQ